jgi:hypothetical protein
VISVADFRLAAREAAIKYASENPGKDLKPLLAKDLAVLGSNPNAPALIKESQRLKGEMRSVENMLVHLPNSPAYLKLKSELKAQIDAIDSTLGPLSKVETTISTLTDSVLNLIATNPKEGGLNFYARSQMLDTFLHQATWTITPGNPVFDRSFVNIATANPGKHCKVVPNTGYNNYYIELTCDGTALVRVRDQNKQGNLTAMSKKIREIRLKGEW